MEPQPMAVKKNDMVLLPYISSMLMAEDDIDDKLLCDHDDPALLQVQQPFAEILSSSPCGGGGGGSSSSTEAEIILEDLMLRGYETCMRGMEKLRVAMANQQAAEKKEKSSSSSSSRAGKRKRGETVARSTGVVDVRTLLLLCAQAVGAGDHSRARELLEQVKQHASETGDATQRVAQCLGRALEARLEGTGSTQWRLLMADASSTSMEDFLEAYRLYLDASSFYKVALSFSTTAILRAAAGKPRLHIVDYGMAQYGLHWAGLLRLLAAREGGPPEAVTITAVARPHRLRPCPAERAEDSGRRLRECARELGVPLRFRAVAGKTWEQVTAADLLLDTEDDDEALVVVDLFGFGTLMDESVFFDNPSPRDTVLRNVAAMAPGVVLVQSVLNSSYGSCFASRFQEALFYYTAMFDAFEATMPRDSAARVLLEQALFGRSAINYIACEGVDLVERPEKYRQWQARNRRAGLRQLPLEPDVVDALRDGVARCHHKDLFVCQDGAWLLQGWMGRILFAHSAWVAAPQDAQ